VTLFILSLPKIIGVTGDSVNPSVQDLDAQVGPDAWMIEI
jgi:hypothetical protein